MEESGGRVNLSEVWEGDLHHRWRDCAGLSQETHMHGRVLEAGSERQVQILRDGFEAVILLKGFCVPFFRLHVMYPSRWLNLIIYDGVNHMLTVIKLVLGALFAALAWLVGRYTNEYFKPYKR